MRFASPVIRFSGIPNWRRTLRPGSCLSPGVPRRRDCGSGYRSEQGHGGGVLGVDLEVRALSPRLIPRATTFNHPHWQGYSLKLSRAQWYDSRTSRPDRSTVGGINMLQPSVRKEFISIALVTVLTFATSASAQTTGSSARAPANSSVAGAAELSEIVVTGSR